ncbi:lysozyme inhibitor LprI family protein [Rhizobium sp. CSW-27]|uniref:lysozyme inhibitor LprI family protein n=1 Tax=Rhizobium sp. CSW-27 TaxID=2839985 RepID=UPI001C020A2C|nr:lysozyme inhibitor LprI family protein [Rhizobium sp. CSW-27]MBT9369476.1 DUF1311 domain-containing protein [Rhizobium sp. CSW-27]
MKLALLSMLCGCVLLVDGPSSAEEPTVACDKAVTQADMTACARKDFEKADAGLNAQWLLTRKAMADRDAGLAADQRGGEQALLAAQRAWIAYRDGQCTAEGFAARGGTMEPMLVVACKAELSEVRTDELKQLAETIGQQ